ncbi:hypothetical protein K435DRAFT_700743 [Dendrothele bispora CBS 962.96]|uniref:Uncharacterized protein n=1 Tax=Dendrothele bispora (strain CBS 962.96) TaxID=1314807 RepID=A0A4S8KR89_DENBC|nr:hypothetical protein K435DRAFT_700743 [Dendrothele bispora CBS 962.96]
MSQPWFSLEDVRGLDIRRELRRLDEYLEASNSSIRPAHLKSGWNDGVIRIPLPCKGHTYASESEAPFFEIEQFWYRRLTDIIRAEVLSSSFMQYWRIKPYKLMFEPDNGSPAKRVWGEAYTSDRALDLEEEIYLSTAQSAEDGLEIVPIYVMKWSDSTHLAEFGDASSWPIYVFFGNISKHICGRPTMYCAHHLAYICSLPDKIRDHYKEVYGQAPTDDVMTHLRRELFQAVWRFLIENDPDLNTAYRSGLVLPCHDGRIRRFMIRFYTYGMDYPERCLAVCMKDNGTCLCARCLLNKALVRWMGTNVDMHRRKELARVDSTDWLSKVREVRRLIFEEGLSVTSERVKKLLDPESLTATLNAFSEAFGEYGFNMFKLITNDILHESEVGEWKRIFTHLVRILEAFDGSNSTGILNKRYRQVPTFGHGTIRRFSNDVSAMRKLAGRDFEDMLLVR